jgi:hypothetical protein
MSDYYHAVVWIDHQQAKIFRFDADDVDRSAVRSNHPHQHLHHKANARGSGHVAAEPAFLEQVAQALAAAGAVLITGPASAKQELAAYIARAHPQLSARISGVEALDHPSDGELLALARKFFRADDRMHAQLRRPPDHRS